MLFLIFKGLNFGIDFKGGILIELRSTDSKVNVSSLRDRFNQMDLGDVSVKKFGNDTDFLVKFENKDNKKNIIEEIKANLDKSFGNNFNSLAKSFVSRVLTYLYHSCSAFFLSLENVMQFPFVISWPCS